MSYLQGSCEGSSACWRVFGHEEEPSRTLYFFIIIVCEMYIHECYCVCAMVCAYALVCMWRQEDDFWKSFFSFYHRFWGSNSGHQVCVASPLPTEPCCSLEKELGGKALRQRCFLTKGDLECGGSWLCTSDGVKLIWEPVAPAQERSQHCPCTWKIEYLGK